MDKVFFDRALRLEGDSLSHAFSNQEDDWLLVLTFLEVCRSVYNSARKSYIFLFHKPGYYELNM